MPRQKSSPILVANWKMNGDVQSIKRLLNDLKNDLCGDEMESGQVIVFPPHVYLQMVAKNIVNTNILLGGQDIDERESGSVTGGVSARMLRDVGCEFVLLGHSERRILFNEDDDGIFQKLKQAFNAGLKAIVCVGENLEQRNSGQLLEVISRQVKAVMNQNSPSQLEELLIAYEPIWAIGSNQSATIDQIEYVVSQIKKILIDVDAEPYKSTKILYGGSVTENNIAEILAIDGVDGALIGGASLDSKSFSTICRMAKTT
ncbi:triose-phosphate isomerase [Gammaproteobacteria bacterium]|nr:triose-phosphate isomerase [Gammaproteobacteria bacterium]